MKFFFLNYFTDRIGRSMPNLNKIRGQNKGTVGLPQGSQLSQGRGTIAYGLSRQHTSDPRMQPRLNAYPGAIPSRGAVMSRDVSTYYVTLAAGKIDLNNYLLLFLTNFNVARRFWGRFMNS